MSSLREEMINWTRFFPIQSQKLSQAVRLSDEIGKKYRMIKYWYVCCRYSEISKIAGGLEFLKS